MFIVTDIDLKTNFDYYLKAVQQGDEIIILKNGKKSQGLFHANQVFLSLLILLQAF